MKTTFLNGIFLIHVETFDQLQQQMRLDNQRVSSQIVSRVIVWLRGYDAPMYWSESLDARMGITVA